MTTPARYYVSTALPTTLASSLGASGNPSVVSLPGAWPTQYPYTVLIDWGLATFEAISVTSAPTGTGPYSLPCTRGIDGTTAQTHASGAQVVHGVTAQDFSGPQAHLVASSSVHGISGSLPSIIPAGLVPIRRIQWRPSSWWQNFQAGHGWTTSGAGVGSSNLNDTSTYCKGTQSATVTTAGNGSQAALSLVGAAAQNMTGKMIRLTFKVDNVAHLSAIAFYLGTSSFASNFLWNVPFNPTYLQYWQSGEWVSLNLSWADVNGAAGYTISSVGVPSTTVGFTDMRLAVYDDSAGAVTIHWQSVEIVPDTSATFPHGVVSVTFDDSYQSVYDLARPYMDNYGYRASLCTIVDQIGQSARLTLAELQSMSQFAGWEVTGHAFTLAAHNAGYNTLTSAQVAAEFEQLKGWLAGYGFNSDVFAYPLGAFSQTTDAVPVDQIASQFFTASRSIIFNTQEAWPPAMPNRLLALSGISGFTGGNPVSAIIAAGGPLDRCYYDGCWTILCLHQITSGAAASTTQISQADFNTLMDAIHSRGIPVLPIGQVVRYYS